MATALALPGPGAGSSALSLAQQNEAAKASRGLPHTDPPGTPAHTHDPRFKNALARGGETVSDGAVDPTTAAQRRDAADFVESERALPDPKLVPVPFTRPRTLHPVDRYAMANGCYTLRTPAGLYLRRTPQAYPLSRIPARRAARFFFKATDLGTYLLLGRTGRGFLSGGEPDGTTPGPVAGRPEPSADGEWTVTAVRGNERPARYRLTLPGGRKLVVANGRLAVRSGDATAAPFVIENLPGCAAYPESQIGVRGNPHAGVSPYQEVRGYIDAHTHGMAYEFLGGEVHCGKPWDKYGVEYALVDCEDHTLTGGNGAVLETFLSERPTHDPVGWPTFKDWPAPDSLTHEGTYYRWMERSWRGGQRLLVNLLVENNKLCEVYPLKRNSCDDMDSIRLQAQRMHQFERYVDAQFGGPGPGLLPDRHRPDPGAPGHQQRPDGRGHGHRDQRAVRLHLQGAARRRRPGLHRRRHHPADQRDVRHGRAPDGARQQVRQRAGRRRGRHRHHRRRRQRRQLPRDRQLLGHGALRAGRRRELRPRAARGARDLPGAAGRAVRRDRRGLRPRRAAGAAALPAPGALQLPRPHLARRAHGARDRASAG